MSPSWPALCLIYSLHSTIGNCQDIDGLLDTQKGGFVDIFLTGSRLLASSSVCVLAVIFGLIENANHGHLQRSEGFRTIYKLFRAPHDLLVKKQSRLQTSVFLESVQITRRVVIRYKQIQYDTIWPRIRQLDKAFTSRLRWNTAPT